jgi:hypothetical protein
MFAKFRAHSEKLRLLIHSTLLWIAAACVGAIAVSVLGEFFIKWAEEAGWYSNPSQRVGRIVSAVGWFLTSWWFITPTVFITGVAAGAWIDWLLRALEWSRTRPTITVRDLAKSLDDFHAEGTRERNRVIPAIADFDYEAERAELVEWKGRVLQKLDVGHVTPAEYSLFRTLKDFEGWAHDAPNKGGPQNHIEAMWNEHLSRLQAIIHRLSGFPPPSPPHKSPVSPLEIIFDPDDDRNVRHRNGATRFYVGVHNASNSRTIEGVSLCALDGPFATEVLAVAHGRVHPSGKLLERDPIMGEWEQINPGVTEYVELFGMNIELLKQGEYEGALTTPQEFTLEIRARDTPKATARFDFDPGRVPILGRVLNYME